MDLSNHFYIMNRIMQSVLDAEYVIDGVKMELSPREILDDAVGKSAWNADALKVEPVVDETVDPDPAGVMPELQVAENLILGSLPDVSESRKIPSFCADSMTCAEIAKALTEVIWREGHFRSGDLEVSISGGQYGGVLLLCGGGLRLSGYARCASGGV